MRTDPCREIVKACWYNLPGLFANVQIDEFVVMPDHVHGILVLTERSVSARRDLINQITTKTESTGWILMKNPKVTLETRPRSPATKARRRKAPQRLKEFKIFSFVAWCLCGK